MTPQETYKYVRENLHRDIRNSNDQNRNVSELLGLIESLERRVTDLERELNKQIANAIEDDECDLAWDNGEFYK